MTVSSTAMELRWDGRSVGMLTRAHARVEGLIAKGCVRAVWRVKAAWGLCEGCVRA